MIKKPKGSAYKHHLQNIFLSSFIILLLILSTLFLILFKTNKEKTTTISKAKEVKEMKLDTSNLSSYSYINKYEGVSAYNLYKEEGYLYKAEKKGLEAVREFLSNNPSINSQTINRQSNDQASFQTLSTDDSSTAFFSPSLTLSQDPIRINKDKDSIYEDYFFNQLIDNYLVYGATAIFNLRNSNQIYSLSGNLVTSSSYTPKAISEEQAIEIALKYPIEKKEVPEGTKLLAERGKVGKVIFNPRFLGLNEDDNTNYLSYVVTVFTDESPNVVPYRKMIFIRASDGEVLGSESLIFYALNRKIYDYSKRDPNVTGTPYGAPMVRKEGDDKDTGDKDVDNAYLWMKEYYDFFVTNFGKESIDYEPPPIQIFPASGVKIPFDVVVHYKEKESCITHHIEYFSKAIFGQRNYLDGHSDICDGDMAKDVLGHELTHGLIFRTADFMTYEYFQPASLQESIADIFATAMDNNWTFGEDTSEGTAVNYKDPARYQYPDRLFSPYYQCLFPDPAHANAMVINKMFYLMSEGTKDEQGKKFNGCAIEGIGRENAYKIIYNALTSYLGPISNFRSIAIAVDKACHRLMTNKQLCRQVERASQVTEIDQQPPEGSPGYLTSPVCDTETFEHTGKKGRIPYCAQKDLLLTPAIPTPTTTLTPIPTLGSTRTWKPMPTRQLNTHGEEVFVYLRVFYKDNKKNFDKIVVNLYEYKNNRNSVSLISSQEMDADLINSGNYIHFDFNTPLIQKSDQFEYAVDVSLIRDSGERIPNFAIDCDDSEEYDNKCMAYINQLQLLREARIDVSLSE